jgi:SLT domain-containing protein
MILPEQRDAIVLPVHAALAAIERGYGTIENRHCIASFLNITSGLSGRMKSAPETPVILERAMFALVAADRRWMKTEHWGFTGPEMLAVRAAVSLGDELAKRANSALFMAVTMAVSKVLGKTPDHLLGSANEPIEVPA